MRYSIQCPRYWTTTKQNWIIWLVAIWKNTTLKKDQVVGFKVGGGGFLAEPSLFWSLPLQSFICSFENCCYSTSRREHLTNHESTHASIESRLNHPCALCYKFFSSKSVLNRHIKTCGKGSSKESESKVDECRCDICGKVLSSSFKLKQHAKLHSDSLGKMSIKKKSGPRI